MYYKTINGRQIFSNCSTIQTNEGIWISNPTIQQIIDAGWLEYIPPEDIPSPITEPNYDQLIQAVKKMLSNEIKELSDNEALEIAALYPTWISKIGQNVQIGERFWYNEKLYKVIQNHTIQEDWTPEVSNSLFVEIAIEEWPEFVQPNSAENAYNIGDKVTFEGNHYISIINNNVWDPVTYPAGWEKQ